MISLRWRRRFHLLRDFPTNRHIQTLLMTPVIMFDILQLFFEVCQLLQYLFDAIGISFFLLLLCCSEDAGDGLERLL